MSATVKLNDGRTLNREQTINAIRNKNTEVIKQITTGSFDNGGALNRQQFDEFYVEVIESASFLDRVRRVPVDGPEAQIDRIGVGERLLRSLSEGTAVTDQSDQINTGNVPIDVEEVGFGWDLSRRVVEDTIEYENTAERILSMFDDQYAADLEALAFGGGLADMETEDADFYGILDGWIASAEADGANVLDASGSSDTLNEDHLFDIAYSTPEKYVDATSPVFVAHPKQIVSYRESLANRETSLGDEMLTGASIPTPTGYPIVGSTHIPADRVMFTDPRNLVFAPHRDTRIDVTTESEAVVKQRLFAQYALSTRLDFTVEQGEAVTIIDGLAEPQDGNLNYPYDGAA